jgi:hypothetical protein
LGQDVGIVGGVQESREAAIMLPTWKEDTSDVPKGLIVSHWRGGGGMR